MPGREVLARPGAARQRASSTGRLVPNLPGSARRVGMVPSAGAALTDRQGYHLEVTDADITLEPRAGRDEPRPTRPVSTTPDAGDPAPGGG